MIALKEDLFSEAGAREWVEHIKALARTRIRDDGGCPPAALLIATRDERTGKKLPEGAIYWVGCANEIINDHGPYGMKDRWAHYIRRLAYRSEAIGYAFMCEAWAVPDHVRAGLSPEESWASVPGNIEVVRVLVQHRKLGDDTRGYTARILRPKASKPRLTGWSEQPKVGGRFADVLRTAEQEAEADAMMPGMLAAGAMMSPEERRDCIDNVRHEMLKTMSKDEVDWRMRAFRELLAEHGQPVAPSPEDPPPPRAENVRLLNIDDEVPIEPEAKA